MKSIVTSIAIFGLALSLAAQAPAKPAPAAKPTPAAKPAPAAKPTAGEQKGDNGYKFDKTVHDYGTIKKGADGTCEFKITNTSKEPLVIQSAVGSCGCTVPKYDKEPIMPGKSTVITVKYDSNRVGPFTKEVTVMFEGKPEPAKVQIKGNVEAPPADTPFPAPGSGASGSGAPVNN